MAETLYSRDILRLAASLVPGDHLDDADGIADLRAPLCGSRIAVEASLSGDRIEAVAVTANACALGQAAAALVKRRAPGIDLATLMSIRERLALALAGDAAMPDDWPELGYFDAARAHSSRHGAILLPFDALIEAGRTARSKAHA